MTLRFDCGEVITAMVTPMNAKGEIDYDRVETLAKHLIECPISCRNNRGITDAYK